MRVNPFHIILLTLTLSAPSFAQTRTATLTLDFAKNLGPTQMDHISLGQGGLSPDAMWDNRIAEVRALHPHLIRLFVQEYFDLLPANGRYHFATLDPSVDQIVRAGAVPLMTIAIKPKMLYPKVDQNIVDPTDYAKWGAADLSACESLQTKGPHRPLLGSWQRGRYWRVGRIPLSIHSGKLCALLPAHGGRDLARRSNCACRRSRPGLLEIPHSSRTPSLLRKRKSSPQLRLLAHL